MKSNRKAKQNKPNNNKNKKNKKTCIYEVCSKSIRLFCIKHTTQ